MFSGSQQAEERLQAMCTMMRSLVESSIREGWLRAIPDPMEARQLAELHSRLLQRIHGMEISLGEFIGDLRRADEVFERAERRTGRPPLMLEKAEIARR